MSYPTPTPQELKIIGDPKPCLRGAAAGGAVSEAVRCAGVGCARYARGVAGCEMRACGAREGQSGEQRAEAEGRTEQPTTARRCSVVA